MESKSVKLVKGNFRSYAAVAQCLKHNKGKVIRISIRYNQRKGLVVKSRICLGWSQYEWTDPPGTQYPSRTNNEYNECVFVQKGNIIFTGKSKGSSLQNNIQIIDMVTGLQYNVEAGDRLSLPRGTIYSTLTHQGATYYWCSKKAEHDEHGQGEWPGQKDEIPEEECPW